MRREFLAGKVTLKSYSFFPEAFRKEEINISAQVGFDITMPRRG